MVKSIFMIFLRNLLFLNIVKPSFNLAKTMVPLFFFFTAFALYPKIFDASDYGEQHDNVNYEIIEYFTAFTLLCGFLVFQSFSVISSCSASNNILPNVFKTENDNLDETSNTCSCDCDCAQFWLLTLMKIILNIVFLVTFVSISYLILTKDSHKDLVIRFNMFI